MAETAIVNPSRRKRRKGRSRMRDIYGRFVQAVKRRRRRRNPEPANNPRRRRRRRRRNPEPTNMTVRRTYSAGGYRQRNPDGIFDDIFNIVPAGVAGIWAGRWAVKMAGPFEAIPGAIGAQPGVSHAIAIWLAARFGAGLIGNLFGDPWKEAIAKIACLSYGGDLFMRKRFMRDSVWMQQNLSLEGEAGLSGLGQDSFVDAAGNKYMRTPTGWRLAGFETESAIGQGDETDEDIEFPADAEPGETFVSEEGEAYQFLGFGKAPLFLGIVSDPAVTGSTVLTGFEEESAIGASADSSFGYSARR